MSSRRRLSSQPASGLVWLRSARARRDGTRAKRPAMAPQKQPDRHRPEAAANPSRAPRCVARHVRAHRARAWHQHPESRCRLAHHGRIFEVETQVVVAGGAALVAASAAIAPASATAFRASTLVEAVRAINRLIPAGLERNARFLAAVRTGGAEHLARATATRRTVRPVTAAAAAALCFA